MADSLRGKRKETYLFIKIHCPNNFLSVGSGQTPDIAVVKLPLWIRGNREQVQSPFTILCQHPSITGNNSGLLRCVSCRQIDALIAGQSLNDVLAVQRLSQVSKLNWTWFFRPIAVRVRGWMDGEFFVMAERVNGIFR
jgi:hypothetical protein